MLTMLRPTLFRLPAAISPSSLRVLASAADSNPKEDATSKDANPKGLESLSWPILNFGLGAFVAWAAFAGMLTSISADIKHNHDLISADMQHNHSEVITKINNDCGNLRSDMQHNHSEVITKIDHLKETYDLKLENVKPTSKQ